MTAPKEERTSGRATADDAQQFELLASALSGRTVRVISGAAGEPVWTDGMSIFIDPAAGEADQIASIVVQASLISAGSLTPQIAKSLNRRTKIIRRYLGIEGHRALGVNQSLLPPSVRALLDPALAARTDSPEASLALAFSRDPLPHPPEVFGTLRPKRLLTGDAARQAQPRVDQQHVPRRQHDALDEIDDEIDNDDAGAAVDMLSVGGTSGALGRLLKRLFKPMRRGKAGGTPGTDTPTHLGRGNDKRNGTAVMSSASTGAVDDGGHQAGTGIRYPEWDLNKKRYRPDWCTVEEIEAPLDSTDDTPVPDAPRLRRSLARLSLGLDQCHRRPYGDDIDIDAAIDAQVQVRASTTPDENVYIDSLRRRRDLSVLVLLDISGSAGESDGFGRTVHERQRVAAAAITATLHDLGDRVALYGFNSRGRSAVHLYPLKRFDDRFNSHTMRRLHSLTPGAYSRLGAAIRHGASILETQGGTSRRLLVVLSDGLAYDHGYDKDYGAADARRALAEARRRGTGGLCLTFGTNTDAESLRRVFGSTAHATVANQEQLAHAIGTLVRSALQSADVRRRIA
ncbi:nitric oxide reductase activation protein NorD [Mycolicibacterium baixiangningiae]|uniref:nitric oxide reductase activation protein NorD n=1 Tax=Mycolicibacterium baixiangningiae TaxID=2761578 RepID=UPI001E523792|nr:VWA domain-containing protein [Mycolicibacterium baixiangningiae]